VFAVVIIANQQPLSDTLTLGYRAEQSRLDSNQIRRLPPSFGGLQGLRVLCVVAIVLWLNPFGFTSVS
jgi:hypothetical protein